MKIAIAVLIWWIVISFVLGPLVGRWLASRSNRYAVPPTTDIEMSPRSTIVLKIQIPPPRPRPVVVVHGEGTSLYGAAEELTRGRS